MPEDILRAEVAIIGSGPGGSTTADVLAGAGKQVLILEEGPDLPLESCEPFSIAEMAQKYRAGGLNPALGKGKIAFVEARCAGGGSEINSGLYHRTPSGKLEEWRDAYRLQEATEDDLMPHFLHCEEALSVTRAPGLTPAASRRLDEGARRLGWRSLEVPRWFRYGDQVGIDGVRLGTRQSMTKTFLARARASGAQLMDRTRARRLRREGAKWTIAAERDGVEIGIEADAVFVSAGAVQTPLLLRRSGITRNVGNTLAMHPTVKVVAMFDDEVNHEQLGVPVHQVKEFAPRISFGCSISSPPYLALAMSDYAGSARIVRERWRRMAIYYAMITGPASGRVRPVFGLPDPMIRYDLSPADLRDLATGLRNLSKLLLAAGARCLYPAIRGGKAIHGEDELSTIPAALDADAANLMTIHLFSSCPMGEDRARTAVDSWGRVHDAPNLRVSDASLLCTAPGVNPQGSVMAFARRNALHFLGAM